MADINQEFASFEKSLKIYMKYIKVRDITRNYLSKVTGEDYNTYTIEQFLILYKLNRMEELGVISEKIASDLREILEVKKEVDTLTGKEAKKELYDPSYKSADLQELHKMSETIYTHLKKYHLTIDDISFEDMIDASIKEKDNKTIKEDNIRVKRMD